jgi:hypothetical protein
MFTSRAGLRPCRTSSKRAIIYYCQSPTFWYELGVNRFWTPLFLISLGGFAFLSPSNALAQNACRVQAVFVRPDFVRPGFERVNVVRSNIERPSLERAALDRADFVRPTFDRPSIIRPVFDDLCARQTSSVGSSSRSTHAAALDSTSERESKVAQNGSDKVEIPRHGVFLAARAKSIDPAAGVGACCGQQPVNREQQHRLLR